MSSRVIITTRDRKRQAALAKIYSGLITEGQYVSFADLYSSQQQQSDGHHDDCPQCIADRAAALAASGQASSSSSSSSSTPTRSNSLSSSSSSSDSDSDASSIATIPDGTVSFGGDLTLDVFGTEEPEADPLATAPELSLKRVSARDAKAEADDGEAKGFFASLRSRALAAC